MHHSHQPARPGATLAPSLGRQLLAIVSAGLLMTISSRIEVPMYPVPMTMQTFAALLVGGLLGARMASIAVSVWLLQGIAGLPVFSGGGASVGHFFGPTGGYLVAFVVMAYLAGLYADRRQLPTLIGAFIMALVAHGLCLVLGTAWLSLQIGVTSAIELGLAPFLAGSVVKSALAAGVFLAGKRYLVVFGRRR